MLLLANDLARFGALTTINVHRDTRKIHVLETLSQTVDRVLRGDSSRRKRIFRKITLNLTGSSKKVKAILGSSSIIYFNF